MPIPGYEGLYSVSDRGRVKSHYRKITRSNGSRLSISARVLKLGIGGMGYPIVVLCGAGKPKTKAVHKLMAAAFWGDESIEVDHRDRVRSNNLLGNLRPASRSQNNANRGPNPNSNSHFKGVSLHQCGKWAAQISVGRPRHLGLFVNEADAAHAYDFEAEKRFGSYAYLNFGTE